ncbi:hypothetical protein GCM10011351_18780 [Paraliobacillus quinghaiensis]|uniref:Uncharacterized protein n=1 Tax=Paraliobacillus quinghaiensis TaxID=470815 RepID=A0A917TRD4_9BACI|nr:hypothetical protein [Paraliobacillus quinghaiensis]GGM32943.1 hypothetical protein GCM10011351_18780 [Paraliobacillus quinghaiensis]
MKHPFEKLLQLQFLAILLAIIFGVFTILSGNLFLAFFTCLLVTADLLFEGLIELRKQNPAQFARHFFRVIMIIIFVSYLYFT